MGRCKKVVLRLSARGLYTLKVHKFACKALSKSARILDWDLREKSEFRRMPAYI